MVVMEGMSAGKKILIDYLINKARGFIFTTGLPPLINILNLKSIQLSMEEEWRRKSLLENSDFFRTGLKELGLNIGQSQSHIVPLLVGDESKCLRLG